MYHLFKIYVFTVRFSINPYISLVIYFLFKTLLIFAQLKLLVMWTEAKITMFANGKKFINH